MAYLHCISGIHVDLLRDCAFRTTRATSPQHRVWHALRSDLVHYVDGRRDHAAYEQDWICQ